MAVKTKKNIVKTTKTGLNSPVFDLLGNQEKEINLPLIFKQTVDKNLVAQAVRVYQSAFHQGTQFTKTRGQVVGSTRKIYRQKGTGKARHGDIKAPIFVGGGIVFGPKPRDFKLTLNKKMRQTALKGILTDKFTSGKIKIVVGLKDATGKTQEITKLLQKLGIYNKKVLLVTLPDMKKAILAARNIENVLVQPANTLSILDIVKYEYIVIAEEALEKINKQK